MQPSKSRSGSSEVSKRISPVIHRSNNPTKVVGSHPDSSSTSQAVKATSPSRTMVPEKRRPIKATELEFEFVKLQEDLKKTRDQLSSSESWKRRAEQEAEAAKKELLIMSMKLKETESQIAELSAAEDARLQELRKISQERDRAWQFELQTLQKQRSIDAAAMASARNEIKRLKLQLEMVLRSEDAEQKKSQLEHSELHETKQNLAQALLTIDNLKTQLRETEKLEAEAKSIVTDTKKQLKIAQSTIDTLLSDGSKLMESFSIVATELKESRSRVNSLEEIVRKFQADESMIHYHALAGLQWSEKLYLHDSANSEVQELLSALETTMIKYQEEQIESTVKIHQAYEWMEKLSNDSKTRETELESRLNFAKSEAIFLKASLFDKEVELRSLSDMNKKLHLEIQNKEKMQSLAEFSELKAKLMEEETALTMVSGENKQLKIDLRREPEIHEADEAAMSELNLAKDTKKEALIKLSRVREESEENGRRVAEELHAALLVNSEMETELRKLRVQAEQWRKAAEAAAAVLMAGNNDRRSLERTSSFSSDHGSVSRELSSSLLSDELDDESPKKKKKNIMMLKKLSGMWKKEVK